MHGDLVFEDSVLAKSLAEENSTMVVSSVLPLPEKDFKAVISEGRVVEVGINCFDNAMYAQALYKLNKADWNVWLDEIIAFVAEFSHEKAIFIGGNGQENIIKIQDRLKQICDSCNLKEKKLLFE